MPNMYDFYKEASEILAESDNSVKIEDVRVVLEDAMSPITNKHIENLYKQVIAKGHIDFDNIPVSKGDIKKYSGYGSMIESLNIARNIATDENVRDVMNAVDTVITAINNIANLADLYTDGYNKKNDYVTIEYQTFVFCCVEATSCILSEFVELVKNFDGNMKLSIKNTKYRAGLLFVDQLTKFNKINSLGNYRNYLQSVLNTGKDNFIGTSMVVGITAVAATILIAVVPITRLLVYNIFKIRAKLSDALALQAYFIEMNKNCVEANGTFDTRKKERIIAKQEKIRLLFTKMSDKLKVDIARASRDAEREIKKDNASLTLGDTRSQVDNSPYDFLL